MTACFCSNICLVYQFCHSPTGIKDTPVVVLLEGHLSMATCKELLSEDGTLLPGPGHPVGVQLGSAERGKTTDDVGGFSVSVQLASHSLHMGLAGPGLPRQGRTG